MNVKNNFKKIYVMFSFVKKIMFFIQKIKYKEKQLSK